MGQSVQGGRACRERERSHFRREAGDSGVRRSGRPSPLHVAGDRAWRIVAERETARNGSSALRKLCSIFHFLLEVGIEARLEGRICPLCNFRAEGPLIAASRRSVYFNRKYEPSSPMLIAIAG